MLRYFTQRFIQFLLIIFIANSLTFLLPRMIPGDPILEAMQMKAAAAGRQNVDIQAWVATYNEKFGLNEPLWKQYLIYWRDLIHFDFGYSLIGLSCHGDIKIKGGDSLDIRIYVRGDFLRLHRRHHPGRLAGLAKKPSVRPRDGAYPDGDLCHSLLSLLTGNDLGIRGRVTSLAHRRWTFTHPDVSLELVNVCRYRPACNPTCIIFSFVWHRRLGIEHAGNHGLGSGRGLHHLCPGEGTARAPDFFALRGAQRTAAAGNRPGNLFWPDIE